MSAGSKTRRALSVLRPHAAPHRRRLVEGGLWTIGLVCFRLALPWPLCGVVELVLPHGRAGTPVLDHLPPGEPLLWLVGLYLLLAAAVGVAEMGQRVAMARFATNTVHDLRAAAVAAALGAGRRRGRSGDTLARLIGDTARIKASLKGILVHITQNGLLALGVCVLFAFISPRLAGLFLLGCALSAAISVRTFSRVASAFKKQRRKEGAYARLLADSLERGDDAIADGGINRASARKDVRVTALLARSSLGVHAALAATSAAAIGVGILDIRAGWLAPGALFLFISYVLIVHRRIVQVGRQLARGGMVIAGVNRIGTLLERAADAPAGREPDGPATLAGGLRLEDVRVESARGSDAPPRLQISDWTLLPGSRVAVLGGPGSGKSTFLRVLAGRLAPGRGRIRWDGIDVADPAAFLRPRVSHLPQEPVFARKRLWKILGLEHAHALTERDHRILDAVGAWDVVLRQPRGLRTRLASRMLSLLERRALRLGAVLLSPASVWTLDAPVEERPSRAAGECLDYILHQARGRTLVASLSQTEFLGRFDRVVVLREGRIHFDGAPAAWLERARTRPDASPIAPDGTSTPGDP
jgi:ABC-type multidrug transport system fused ATPase/permease subunit